MSKGVLRMTGNVVGAAFGFVVMAAPGVAGSPWGLAALLAAWSAGCGSLAHSRAKYAAYLALYTVSVIILAQVGGLPVHFATAGLAQPRTACLARCFGQSSVKSLRPLRHHFSNLSHPRPVQSKTLEMS